MPEETKHLLAYLKNFDEQVKADQYKPKVNRKIALGLFALIYEKARNLVDYQEEHLLLRRAITRILIRRVKFTSQPTEILDGLINELLMAKYIENDTLPVDRLEKFLTILNKYLYLNQCLGQRKLAGGESTLDFLLTLAAREIEEIMVPGKEDTLINFAFSKLASKTEWGDEGAGNVDERDTRLLVAIMRALGKYEDRTVYYKLWRLYFPDWTGAGSDQILLVAKNFDQADLNIKRFLSEPIGEKILRRIKKTVAPFEILHDLINRQYFEVEEMFSAPEKLVAAASYAARQRYDRARSALRHSAINSFVYIFITKMVFAIALEVPYEALMGTGIRYLPIGINLLFPPLLMLFLALSVEMPTNENTKKIVDQIVTMTLGNNGLDKVDLAFSVKPSRFGTYFYRLFYFLAFVLAFGGTLYILRKLHFSIVSLGVFYFFVSTISFFAFRIRSSFKELVVGEQGSNFVSAIFDFFMLPFIKLGRVISTGLSNLNIFVFIFDIIIEAPFKLVLEVIEEWIRFLREKKEEALNVIK